MKAKIVSQRGVGSVTDWAHGGYTVKRLVVEEADNLTITLHGDQVDAFTGFKLNDDCKVLGEIEVPYELVEKAIAFVRAQTEFNRLKSTFEALLG